MTTLIYATYLWLYEKEEAPPTSNNVTFSVKVDDFRTNEWSVLRRRPRERTQLVPVEACTGSIAAQTSDSLLLRCKRMLAGSCDKARFSTDSRR